MASYESSLPFLVTHWLSQYHAAAAAAAAAADDDNNKQETTEAVARVRAVAAELASAFGTLGAFGTATKPLLQDDDVLFEAHPTETTTTTRPATFADTKRQWPSCPPDHLEHLVNALAVTEGVCDQVIQEAIPPNLLQWTVERKLEQQHNPESGRLLMETIDVDNTSSETHMVPRTSSALQAPLYMRQQHQDTDNAFNPLPGLTLASEYEFQAKQAANAVRAILELRESYQKHGQTFQTLKRSLELQQRTKDDLQQQRATVEQQNGALESEQKMAALGEIAEQAANCDRVTAQLQRQVELLNPTLNAESRELIVVERKSKEAFQSLNKFRAAYRDPLYWNTSRQKGELRNQVVMNLQYRALGRWNGRLAFATTSVQKQVRDTRRSIVVSRFSHAATINAHLAYPVYCLRFDRTGRYFISGADDYLVKLFCLGSSVTPRVQLDSSEYVRGAVLVCTLRGHAGVINDIDVSSDNSFLATASEDGDCRVWGLKDGRPVAILRGHGGGANMVSWSTLTPYQLVTAGADGFARTWDIREACLKRYGKYIGKRPEYRLDDGKNRKSTSARQDSSGAANDGESSIPLPPLPARGELHEPPVNPAQHDGEIPLPPLPPPAAPDPDHVNADPNDNDTDAGDFVANDTIDEGVKLLSKLQHGATTEERAALPGTRSRRAPVKVICVSRCPFGGYFATGSDDGICRVWRDEDDPRVQAVDDRISTRRACSVPAPENHLRRTSCDRLLLTLRGHVSALTDLQYSHAGNRLLTASQKDGVVRIWSWETHLTSGTGQVATSELPRTTKVSHIMIQLANPDLSPSASGDARRRPNRSAAATVSCDAATWTCDDAKIVTSQCELLKQSGTAIAPGSQFICLWDSPSGTCLLAISGAHKMQCPAVIPHPFDPSMLASAGADGVVKLWDCETGKTLFAFTNTVTYGPVDPNDRGKASGFLDGAFFPDGSGIILTDDSGRVSIFDSTATGIMTGDPTPAWMREQYFSNDYYELFYNANGYCVERGSELPPHLAPTGARCSHAGAPFADKINDAFRKLSGPMPLIESVARFNRQRLNDQLNVANRCRFDVPGNIVSQVDPLLTAVVRGSSSFLTSGSEKLRHLPVPVEPDRPRQQPRLSSNYRWRDYSDALQEEGNDDLEPDSDDEEFELNDAVQSSRVEDSESGSDLGELFDESPHPRRRHGLRNQEESESDGDFDEFMSTNTMPSGPFKSDYSSHFYRMTSRHFITNWLRRVESNSSFSGRKNYCPQLGDKAVYIPRAHLDTVSEMPFLGAPWESWPNGAVWPIVECCVRHVRYRFPFRAHPNRDFKSAVAVLYLEVTGIPAPNDKRSLPWPEPSFMAPPKSHMFELCFFVSNKSDFLIPYSLYMSRLNQLEYLEALDSAASLPDIEAFYIQDDKSVRDDRELLPYQGQVIHVREHRKDKSNAQASLQGSGFGSLQVLWRSDRNIPNELDFLSPWEVNVVASGTPYPMDRPRLSDGEKAIVRNGCNVVKGLPDVDQAFGLPVNDTVFTDYPTHIEVPMDLEFISNRLEADYYSTRQSIVSDMRLIRHNCSKYNGEDDHLTKVADEMCAKFEEAVLSTVEMKSLIDFEQLVIENVASRSEPSSDVVSQELAQRRSRSSRVGTVGTSSLENLASASLRRSARNVPSRQSRGRSLRTNAADSPLTNRGNSRRGRSTRSHSQYADSLRSERRVASMRTRSRDRDPANAPIAPSLLSGPARGRRSNRSTHGNAQVEDSPRPVGARATRALARGESRALNVSSRNGNMRTRNSVLGNAEDARESVENERPRRLRRTQPVADEESSVELQVRASGRTVRRQAIGESSDDDESVQPRRRSAQQHTAMELDTSEGESDGEASEEEATPLRYSRTQRGQASERTRRSTGRSKPTVTLESENEDVPSDSGQGDAHSSKSAEWDDDHGDASSESSVESSARRSGPRRRSKRKSPTKSKAVTSRRMGARRNGIKRQTHRDASPRHSYLDPSSSEFGSDVESGDDSPEPPKKRHKGVPSSPSRQSRRTTTTETSPLKSDATRWPPIDLKKITEVTNCVLDRLATVDSDGVFAIPVDEAFPEIATSYRKVIKQPMDFRTIREERITVYSSISELQADLVTTFENCIRYNGSKDDYSLLAASMLTMLDDIFSQVCDELDVLLPRRWRSHPSS